jgi:sterol 3beta-glucosyltransferase
LFVTCQVSLKGHLDHFGTSNTLFGRVATIKNFDNIEGDLILRYRNINMAPVEEDLKKRVGRKLTKINRHPHRMPSAHIPERLRHGDDEQEDVTAPVAGTRGSPQYMNQSIFSMIAAAGSRTDFHARFDESSDSEDDDNQDRGRSQVKHASEVGTEGPRFDGSKSTILEKTPSEDKKDKGKLSQHRLIQALPKLSLKSQKGKGMAPSRSRSPATDQISGNSESMTPEDAPMLGRMLTAQAELDANALSVDALPPSEEAEQMRRRTDSSPATLLAVRLREIFEFEKPEKVISEYPCWLLQSVLLQGYMYITQNHICFYAYLPKKSNVAAKTGYLSKRGRQNPKYNRYWFTLKGDVLSYYSNPSDLYFPHGNVDLRYGISAAMVGDKEKQRDSKDFTVTTDHRTYHFRADSAASAREWVKLLQKVIFRSHNDGDSVKISLPIENVIDIEESPVVEFAQTFKIRVIESGDSYAIDEVRINLRKVNKMATDSWQYFFSFFSLGEYALNSLTSLINDTAACRISQDLLSPTSYNGGDLSPRATSANRRTSIDPATDSPRGRSTPPLRDSNRATLMPPASDESGRVSPRLSGDFTRTSRDMVRSSIDFGTRDHGRASFDRGRRSGSTSRLSLSRERRTAKSPLAKKQGSSTDTMESASQILNGSEVFHSPTATRLEAVPSASTADIRKRSEDTTSGPSHAKPEQTLAPRTRPAALQGPVKDPNSTLDEAVVRNTSSPNLQDLVKAGAYPLQRVAGFAEYLKNRSSRMSRLLATESMGYVEKVSGMWAGGRKHYGQNEGVMSDRYLDPEDEEASVGHGDRFRAHFALPPTEKLQATYFGYMHRVLPLYGKIYISNRHFCFRSLLPGTRTKLILPLKDIENVDKEKGFRFGYHGLVLVIRGHEELFFEFNAAEHRDDCVVTLFQNLEEIKYMVESGLLAKQDQEDAFIAKVENEMLQEARKDPASNPNRLLSTSTEAPDTQSDAHPILFDDPRASILNFKPTQSLHITCLTIGSRGDVQPYIALCKGLLAEGHKPRIATHLEFEPWVRKHGIDFRPVEGDPAELMRICVENGMFTYSFLKEASLKFRDWIDELLSSAWKACEDTDILIESPSAMAGIHIAEALGIPYFRAFTMPWTRTRAYPHAFAVPDHKIGGAYNYFSYVMFDNVFWKAIAGQVNRWRKKELGLRGTNLDKLQPNKVPFLYNFSPHVVVPPLDYSDWVRVTGYWFLDEGEDWTPPDELTAFIAKARREGKKIVYIGFGSIVVSDPAALTKTVVDSVLKAGVWCILSKGWSDRLGDPAAVKTEVPLPPEIHQIKSAPHDWLFKQIDAAVHHGGAGTTGASLRAGLPTIVKPFFGDQFFSGSRVEDLGVGICLKKVNVGVFSRALWEATHSERMIIKARVLGEQIRKVCV